MAAVLDAGLPLVAFLQLVRVYGQALAQIADAEVKLFHLYVHEPLIRDGAPGLEIAEEMADLAAELLPLAAPIMDHVHQRFLQHFDRAGRGRRTSRRVADDAELGRLRGGDRVRRPRGLHAADRGGGRGGGARHRRALRRGVAETLPDDARVIKTIGDEVMVVGADTGGARRLGGRLPGAADRAPAAAHRHPRRPRRCTATATTTAARSTSPPGSARAPRAARCSSRARCGRPRAGTCVRAHRRGEAEGLRRGDRAVPGPARRGSERRLRAGGGERAARRARRRPALRRPRLRLPARPRRPAGRAGDGAARQLRAARRGGRRRGALPRAVRAARRAARRSVARGRAARATCRRGRATSATPRPSGSPRARSPPATPPPTRWRPSSTGSPPRPAAARCSACPPARAARPAAARASRAETTAAYCGARGLAWREDPSNATSATPATASATSCSRAAPHPAAEAQHPAHARAAARRGRGAGRAARPDATDARRRSPPCRSRASPGWRLPGAGRRPVGQRSTCDAILALPRGAAARSLDLGGGLRAVAEYGRLRFERRAPPARRRRRRLAVPGRAAFGPGRADRASWARSPSPTGRWPPPRSRRAGGPRLARRRPDAPARAWAAAAPCRTCSPTARSRARAAARSGGALRRRDRLGPGRRHRRALPGRRRPRAARAARLARSRLDCAPDERRDRRDPRPGRRPPAPGPAAGRGDLARLRGQGPAADRRAQGRRSSSWPT